MACSGYGKSHWPSKYWVAVKELSLRYYIGELLLLSTFTHCGNLIPKT